MREGGKGGAGTRQEMMRRKEEKESRGRGGKTRRATAHGRVVSHVPPLPLLRHTSPSFSSQRRARPAAVRPWRPWRRRRRQRCARCIGEPRGFTAQIGHRTERGNCAERGLSCCMSRASRFGNRTWSVEGKRGITQRGPVSNDTQITIVLVIIF